MTGVIAIVFALVMMGVGKIYDARKKKEPRVLLWITVAFVAAISLYLVGTEGCSFDPVL